MAQKNEFLRGKPQKGKRKLIYDLTNLIIPVVLILLGIFLSSQLFFNFLWKNGSSWAYINRYCGNALFWIKSRLPFVPKEYPLSEYVYPIFNPFVIMITIFTNPFDDFLQDAISASVLPGIVCSVLAILVWFVISIIRTAGMNKNKNLYGTARWGTVKDLKKFGLCEKHGVVLAQQYSAQSEAIINRKGNFGLKLMKKAALICHAGTSHTLVIAPTRSGKGVGTVSLAPSKLSFFSA